MADIAVPSPRKPRVRRRTGEEAPTTPDAIELAMEAERKDRSPTSPARAVLVSHNRLLQMQIANERMSLLLKALTAVVGVAVAGVLAYVAWSAAAYRGVVIDAFRVPPDLVAKGQSGPVVASRMLDQLSTLQNSTRSLRARDSYANSWSGEIKVQIPQTNVAVDDLLRVLREWLGKETRITGEVVHTSTGLRVTARAGDSPARAFDGREDELEKLLGQAAESIYAGTQPYRYAIYLSRQGRAPGSITALTKLAQGSDIAERGWALAALTLQYNRQGDLRQALAKGRAAVAVAPQLGLSHANLAGVLINLGRSDEALKENRLAADLLKRSSAQIDQRVGTQFAHEMAANVAASIHDHALAAREAAQAAILDETGERGAADEHASQLAQGHDIAGAERVLGDLPPPPPKAVADGGSGRQAPVAIAVAREDWATAHARVSEFAAAEERGTVAVNLWPLLAQLKARLGDVAGAQALLRQMPADCYDCAVSRGVVAGLARDWPQADAAFAQAAVLGPSLADAEFRWAESLLARGQPAAAVARASAAARKAPRWAEPEQVWGEALLASGDAQGALKHFKAAAERAPRWARTQMTRGDALAALGKRSEARKAWTAALTLFPSAPQEAGLRRRLAAG